MSKLEGELQENVNQLGQAKDALKSKEEEIESLSEEKIKRDEEIKSLIAEKEELQEKNSHLENRFHFFITS